jgi:hypothetical protein
MNVTRKLNFINSQETVSCPQRQLLERGRQTKAYIVLRWYSRCDSLSRRQCCYSQKYANNKKLLHFQQNHFHFLYYLDSLITFGWFLNWILMWTSLIVLNPHKWLFFKAIRGKLSEKCQENWRWKPKYIRSFTVPFSRCSLPVRFPYRSEGRELLNSESLLLKSRLLKLNFFNYATVFALQGCLVG